MIYHRPWLFIPWNYHCSRNRCSTTGMTLKPLSRWLEAGWKKRQINKQILFSTSAVTGEVKALKFAFLLKEMSVILLGCIDAPCLVYSSLSIDKFTRDKYHEHKCPTFRRPDQVPGVQVPGKQWCLGNWFVLKAVKQRENSICCKKYLHWFILSFVRGLRRVTKTMKGLSSYPRKGKLYVNPSNPYGTCHSYYGKSPQYITTSVIKIIPLTLSLHFFSSHWIHYFLFNPHWTWKMVDFHSLYSDLHRVQKQISSFIAVLALLGCCLAVLGFWLPSSEPFL